MTANVHRGARQRLALLSLRLALSSLFIFLIAGFLGVGRSSAQPPALPHAPDVVPLPQEITWGTGASKWQGFWGRRETLRCPAGGPLEMAWGTDIYTDDSSICTAAVHAGLISAQQGGVVTVEIRPDAGQYGGTSRNGMGTGDWMEPWNGAFIFVWGEALKEPEPAIAATDTAQVDSWAGQVGRVLTFQCNGPLELHTIYGTDVYTDDSSVCSAAVHAGLITQKAGGMVTIKLQQGINSFTASTRNGVTSYVSNGWKGQSFTFVATPPGTPPAPTESTPYLKPPGSVSPPSQRQAKRVIREQSSGISFRN